MIRIAVSLGALACAVAIGAGGVTVAADGGARGASGPGLRAVVGGSARANRAAAQADAASLLTRLLLAAGATQSSIEPAGDGGYLGHPGEGSQATPNLVEDHTWWVLPGARTEVVAYIRAHPPAGSAPVLSGSSDRDGVTTSETQAFAWPPVTGVLATRWLVITAVGLADGATGLRVDAKVVWVTPRPASERVPAGTRLLRISVSSEIKRNQPRQRPLSVRSAKRIEAIVARLNSLPATQPGLRSCPADFGVRVRLAFYARRGAPPSAVAEADPAGCGEVQLTIGGTPQPSLEGGRLIDVIDRVLGVKLNIARP
jgi:hypothetical protein